MYKRGLIDAESNRHYNNAAFTAGKQAKMAFTIDKRTQQAMDAITMSEMQAAGQGGIEGKAANPNSSVKSNSNGGLALDMPPIVTYDEHEEVEEQDEGPIPRFQRWIIFRYNINAIMIQAYPKSKVFKNCRESVY